MENQDLQKTNNAITAKSWNVLLKPGRCNLTVLEAFEGTNVLRALRVDPDQTRTAVIKAIIEVSEYIDAKKRLTTVEEYAEVFEELTQRFQNFTLEDFKLALQNMKASQYYERLKLAEYVAAFAAYDQKKCEAATQRATNNQRKEGQQRAQVITGNLADLIQLQEGEQPLYTNAWLKGQRQRLTHAQRQELVERDKNRRQ